MRLACILDPARCQQLPLLYHRRAIDISSDGGGVSGHVKPPPDMSGGGFGMSPDILKMSGGDILRSVRQMSRGCLLDRSTKSFVAGAVFCGRSRDASAIPTLMDWRTLLLGILKGVLAFLADEFDPPSRRAPKKAPPPPKTEEPAHSAGWAAPTEPPAVSLIVVETDAGSTVAAASFIGSECFGTQRVERERRPGESRRARRGAHTVPETSCDHLTAPRHPRMVEFAQRVRERADAEHAHQQQEARRAVRKARHPGVPLAVSQLTPSTMAWLEVGEPLKYAPKVA